jgi:hypothetical protein
MKKAAEILVECGYGYLSRDFPKQILRVVENVGVQVYPIDLFADTLEGRRQADAIEDWLSINHYLNWHKSRSEVLVIDYKNCHKWRLDRIKWCLEQLEISNEKT